MVRTLSCLMGALVALTGALTGCGKKSDEAMVREYMEFYYPPKTESTYDIIFDWGTYVISTHTPVDEEVHPDAQKYRGYITMRPDVVKPKEGFTALTYLITPQGQVWSLADSSQIPAAGNREEVTVEKTAQSTSTSTTTIQSPSEPVIDHFLANPAAWQRYGTLEKSGDQYKFKASQSG